MGRVGRRRRNRVVDELPVVAGGWPCVLADPPWSFRDRGSRIAPDQRRKRLGRKGYRTLDLEQLLAMPVREVAAPDALLFLWTTSAHLLDGSATAVARAWGFEPKTTIAWVKVRPAKGRFVAAEVRWTGRVFAPLVQIGMGHYVRGSHELLVVARRGRARVLDRGVPSVIFAPRGAHSVKPVEAYELVERLAGGPRLELFARGDRAGWTAWGDQARRATTCASAA